jgi:DNA/RNA-binding domain of Phe-tRNA-synthetase-like protein
MVEFRINKEIFSNFPNLFVNVVIIKDFSNKPSPEIAEKIVNLLRTAEKSTQAKFSSTDELIVHPYVNLYFELFRKFGVNPKRVSPSHFALLNRIVKGGQLPDINPVVNLYNTYSVQNITPFGGENLDKVNEFFELKYASGTEKWLGIGESDAISPTPHDIIWTDKTDVSTLSLNWRQCDKTKIDEETTSGYFIMEGDATVNKENILKTGNDFIQEFTTFLGGKGYSFVLDKENPKTIVT